VLAGWRVQVVMLNACQSGACRAECVPKPSIVTTSAQVRRVHGQVLKAAMARISLLDADVAAFGATAFPAPTGRRYDLAWRWILPMTGETICEPTERRR